MSYKNDKAPVGAGARSNADKHLNPFYQDSTYNAKFCAHFDDLVYLPNTETYISQLVCRLCREPRDRGAVNEGIELGEKSECSSNLFAAHLSRVIS